MSRMSRSRVLAVASCCIAAVGATAVPAQALTTTISNATCTVRLSTSESDAWSAATDKTNNIDEGDVMPLRVKVANAAATRAAFDSKLANLDNDKSGYEAELVAGDPDEDRTKLLKGNIAVISAMQDLSGKYTAALDACADGKTYNSSTGAVTDPSKDTDKDDRNTSSNMSESSLYALLGLLAVAGLTTFAAFFANGGVQLPGF